MPTTRFFLCLAFCLVLAGGVEVEEDSDVEYATPELRRSVRAPRAKPAHSAQVDEASDDLGQIDTKASTPDTPETEVPKPPQRLVRMYEEKKNYFFESTMVTILMLLGWRFFSGKSQNAEIAHKWLIHNLPLLEKNFSLIGDDGNFGEKTGRPVISRDSPNNLVLFCSGRRNSASCIFRFELIARQDLLSSIINIVARARDTLTVRFELDQPDMPIGFCCAVVPTRRHREYKEAHGDMKIFTTSKGAGYKGLPKHLTLLCDSEAAALEVLPAPVRELMHNPLFHSLHITDTSPFADTTRPRVVQFKFQIPSNLAELDSLLLMVFHVVDLVPKMNLSDKEIKGLKQSRDSIIAQVEKEKAQEKEEEIARKRLEKKRKEQEALESKLEKMTPDQRRKLESKLVKQQQRKAQSKGKIQFMSM